jgi:hypothetical protein
MRCTTAARSLVADARARGAAFAVGQLPVPSGLAASPPRRQFSGRGCVVGVAFALRFEACAFRRAAGSWSALCLAEIGSPRFAQAPQDLTLRRRMWSGLAFACTRRGRQLFSSSWLRRSSHGWQGRTNRPLPVRFSRALGPGSLAPGRTHPAQPRKIDGHHYEIPGRAQFRVGDTLLGWVLRNRGRTGLSPSSGCCHDNELSAPK